MPPKKRAPKKRAPKKRAPKGHGEVKGKASRSPAPTEPQGGMKNGGAVGSDSKADKLAVSRRLRAREAPLLPPRKGKRDEPIVISSEGEEDEPEPDESIVISSEGEEDEPEPDEPIVISSEGEEDEDEEYKDEEDEDEEDKDEDKEKARKIIGIAITSIVKGERTTMEKEAMKSKMNVVGNHQILEIVTQMVEGSRTNSEFFRFRLFSEYQKEHPDYEKDDFRRLRTELEEKLSKLKLGQRTVTFLMWAIINPILGDMPDDECDNVGLPPALAAIKAKIEGAKKRKGPTNYEGTEKKRNVQKQGRRYSHINHDKDYGDSEDEDYEYSSPDSHDEYYYSSPESDEYDDE